MVMLCTFALTFKGIKNANGVWGIELVASGSSVLREIHSNRNICLSDYKYGPDLRILSRGNELTLQMSTKMPGDIFQICSYRNF